MTTLQNQLLEQICDLQADYPDFHLWIRNDSPFEFDIYNPLSYSLIPSDIPGYSEIMGRLGKLAKPLGELNRENKRGKLTRNECFKYIQYARKWLGAFGLPGNLAKLKLSELREVVDDLYKGDLPALTTEVTYKGVLSVLRGLRIQGYKVTLRAKLPQLLDQVKRFVPDWDMHYQRLVEVVDTFDKVVHQALDTLHQAFKEVGNNDQVNCGG